MIRFSAFPEAASVLGAHATILTADFNVTGFAGATAAIVVLLLLLARATKTAMIVDEEAGERKALQSGDLTESQLDDGPSPSKAEPVGDDSHLGETVSHPDESDAFIDGTSRRDDLVDGSPHSDPEGRAEPPGTRSDHETIDELPTNVLLGQVALSHGIFASVLIVTAVITTVPWDVLGLYGPTVVDVLLGIGLGVALYGANEASAAFFERAGFGRDETLRELLAPETAAGWLLLLVVVLPIIAGFEELLFRGALIGAFAVGFDLSPWLLAVLSSVVFGVGHGVQGTTGIIVTGILGFVLAAAFVVTGSLVVVIVAHYVVNALEFILHEWLDLFE